MALEGALTRYRIGEILFDVARRQRTGILTVQGRDDIVAISFHRGLVVAADALNKTVEDGLREVLVEREWVSPEEFVVLSSEHLAGGGRVLDLLVERGYLGRDRMLEALREQTYRLLVEVFRWRGGDYKFYAGDEVFAEEGVKPIPVTEALVRAAREMGSDGPLVARVPSSDTVYQRGASGSISPPSESDLSLEEKSVLGAVDGRHTVAEIAEAADGDLFGTTYLLYRLEQAGLIRVRFAGGTSVASALDWSRSELAVGEPAPLRSTGPAPVPARRVVGRWGVRLPEVLPATLALLATLLAVVLLVVLVQEPMSYLHPFPWERGERRVTAESRSRALMLKLDGAIRAYQLVEGRPPSSLEDLESAGLVAADDVRDPATGRRLVLSSGETSFTVLEVEDETGEAIWASGSFTGDFLLEPSFSEGAVPTDRPPLVLLD